MEIIHQFNALLNALTAGAVVLAGRELRTLRKDLREEARALEEKLEASRRKRWTDK